jgi:4-amino-4-deoxy-L-arabinose transferase-like glycosyltransferase
MLPKRGQPVTRVEMQPGTMRYNRAADYTPGLTWSSKSRAIWMSEPTSDPPGAMADASRSPLADDARPAGPRWIARPWVFAAALVVLAAGLWLLDGPSIAAGTGLWAVGLILMSWSCLGPALAKPACHESVSRIEAGALAAILFAGLAARLWAPESFPNGIQVDEAAMGLIALDILRGQGPHPFGLAFIGDPAPFMYLEALMMWLFGPGVGSIRLLAGLAGAAGLATLWWLARPLFGPAVALLATALLAVSASHLHFSRMALNVIEIPLFGLLAVALAWRGLRDVRPAWHLLAGMALGFSQYANFGARAFVLAVGGHYFLTLVRRPRSWRAVVAGGALALVGMLVVLGPQLAYVRDDPDSLVNRLRFRSVFRRWDQATEIHGTDEPIAVLLGQARINLLAFATEPDRGPFYGYTHEPLLSGPVAVLCAVGLVIAVMRLRDPRYALLLVITGCVLVGGVFSAGAPQFHRLVPLVPIACLLAGIGTIEVVRLLARWPLRRASRLGRIVCLTVPVLLVTYATIDGLLGVFVRDPALQPWQPQTAWARWAASQQGERTILLAGAPDVFAWDDRVRLLTAGRTVLDVQNPTTDVPLADERYPLVLALNPKQDDWLPLYRYLLPDTAFDTIAGPDGQPLLLEARVARPPDPRQESRGLWGEITVDDAPDAAVTRQDAALAFNESARLSDRRPYHARWGGSLLVDDPGRYRLEVYTDGGVELDIDGTTIVDARPAPNPRSLRADLNLTAGPHPIAVRYTYLRGPGPLELRWHPPGRDRALVPPSALSPLPGP